jgi:hypothetical protein
VAIERRLSVRSLPVLLGLLCAAGAPGCGPPAASAAGCARPLAATLDPGRKLGTYPGCGVPGSYLVDLRADVADAPGTAAALAARHGGTLIRVWESFQGFAILLDDARAPALAAEPEVAFVQQVADAPAAAP